jgi:hypothetical protein
MFWKFNLGKFEFQEKAMYEEYLGNLQDVAKGATKAFIKAAAIQVPVDTGMARASLYSRVRTFSGSNSTVKGYLGLTGNMSRMSRARQPRNRAGQFRARKKWYYSAKGKKDGYRTIPRGRELGLFVFDYTNSSLKVRWDSKVFHYIKRESLWQSRAAGTTAFNTYVEAHRKDLQPQLLKFVHYTKTGNSK